MNRARDTSPALITVMAVDDHPLLLDGIKVGEKLPVAAAAPAAATSLFSSWKTILALVGAFALGIGLTALLMRRRRQPPEPALQTSEQALTASRRTPFP